MARQDKSGLFRREALERLDDIDELDRLVTVTHPRAWLALAAVAVLLVVALAWASLGRLDTTASGQGVLLAGGRTLTATTLTGGQVQTLAVSQGDRVSAGQTVAEVLPSDGSDAQPVTSAYDGVVGSVQAVPGQYVAAGARLLTVVPEEPLVATLYLPVDQGKKVAKGQEVQVAVGGISPDEYGYLRARVTYVAGVASTPEDLMSVLQNEFLARQVSAAGPVVRIEAALERDPSTPSGYAWSSSDGPDAEVTDGTTCSARIVLSSAAPITYVFPALGRLGGTE